MADWVAVAHGLQRLDTLLRYKTAADVASAFGADLEALARQAWRGKMRASSVASQMRAMLNDAIRAAYVEAFTDAGLDESDMDTGDEAVIAQAQAEQDKYVDGFAQAVIAARNENDLRDQILNRVGLWQNSIEAVGLMAQANVNAKQLVTWHLGKTETHCDTCKSLDGQTHTRAWFADRGYFPRQPGAAMDCGGYNCDCTLDPAKRNQRRGYISRDVPNAPQPTSVAEGA